MEGEGEHLDVNEPVAEHDVSAGRREHGGAD